MELLHTPQGEFTLKRYPPQSHPSLRAWDAADELLLQEVAALAPRLPASPRVWIFNDSFGALNTALHGWRPVTVSDSFLCAQGCEINYRLNGLSFQPEQFQPATGMPEGRPDLVLIKVPKTLALLEDQLCRLKPLLGPDTRVIGAAMAKHIHRSTLALFETLIGPTRTSLARKKARLIFTEPDSARPAVASPYPSRYQVPELGLELSNHANVFCRERLDIGTRLLLEHLPRMEQAADIIDLGCGNGVIGLMAAKAHPDARIHLVDESYMAVASAEENIRRGLENPAQARFRVGNCLDGFAPDSADLIINNPPFHQQQAVGDHIAWQMFKQSHRCLRPGGELWVIGNRHLGYHVKLKRLFGNCATVASNRKFVLLKAVQGPNSARKG